MLRMLLKFIKANSNSFSLSAMDVEFQLFFFYLLGGNATEALVLMKSIMADVGKGNSKEAHSDVHSLLRVIQATLLDDIDFESTSARIEGAPATASISAMKCVASASSILLSTAMKAGPASGIWGPNTSAIFQ